MDNMRNLESLRNKVTKKIDKVDIKLSNNELNDDGRTSCYLSGKIDAYRKTIKMIDKMIREERKRISEWCDTIDDLKQYEDDDIF